MNLPATLHPFRQASKIIAVALAIAACVLITSSSKAVGLTQTVSASASGDTQIRSANPNTNYGGATTITVDGDEPAGTGRDTVALIRFSLPTLPAGAAITDTKLRLGLTNSSANTYNVYVMKKAWVEGQATWNEYKTSNVWELAGGLGATDRESPAIASITPNTTGVRDYDLGAAFDQQVGDWMRGVEANNGIQLINANAPDGFDFFTREVATASQRPQLIITYDDGILADTTPPETTITSGPAEGGTLTTDSATFGFSSSEANSKFACSLDGAAYSACSSPKSYSSLADGPHTFSARATDAAGNTDATPASRTWTINTAATPASDTVTLSAVADTQIVENTPTTNYGAATEFEADGDDPGGSGTDIYTLLRFDLSSLPADASITSANVALNVTNSSAQQYQSYEVKRSWAEGEATWNLASTGTPWGTAGAKAVSDRGQTPAANVLLQALGDHAFSLPVSLVQDWRDNPATNYGILISNVTNTDGWRAASKETTTPPRLVVNYSTSGGADTTPPETTIDSGPSGTVINSSATFNFSSSESNSTFECSLDGAAYSVCTSPKDYTNLSNGSHTFEVRAKDEAGNVDATPASRTFSVEESPPPPPADTTPPETTIDSGPSRTVNSSSASFAFSSSEPDSTFECKLDGGGFASCTSPKSYTGLTDGAHTFQVKVKDAAGNTDASPASSSWTIDATPPTISTVEPADGAAGVGTTSNVEATFSEAMNSATIDSSTFALAKQGSTTPVAARVTYDPVSKKAALDPDADLEADATYTATLKGGASGVKDEVGNPLAEDKTWSFTTAAAPPLADTTPPETTIDSGPSGTVNSSSASFAFSSDEAGSTFECKLDADTFASCTSPKAYGGLSNGSHTFEVRATDAAGNTDATPASRTWTVLLPALPPPPSGTLEKFEPGDGQIYDGVDANQQAGDTVAISTQKWADYSANVLGGEKPLISHTFTGYDTNMTFDMEIAKARGAVPLVTWQTGSGTSPKTIANAGQASSGNRSDYVILKVAHALRTYDQPVFLRIDQEMNAYWFAWCAYNSDGTPRAHTTEDFKDMWRRMHIIFEGGTVSSMNQKLAAEGMPPLDPAVGTSAASKGLSSTTDPSATLAPTNNVAFVFNPVDAPGIPNKVGNLWADYYPGDKYVDWVGQTSYDTTWNATLDVRFGWLGQFYQDFAVGHDKPYMMGEWGLEQYMGDDPAYLQRMLDWQKVHPKVKALVYFNVQTSKLEHRLEVYPNSAALMRADAPRYLDEVSVR